MILLNLLESKLILEKTSIKIAVVVSFASYIISYQYHRLIYWNRTFEVFTGYSWNEPEFKSIFILMYKMLKHSFESKNSEPFKLYSNQNEYATMNLVGRIRIPGEDEFTEFIKTQETKSRTDEKLDGGEIIILFSSLNFIVTIFICVLSRK